MSQQKYVVDVDIKKIESMMKGLKKFRKQTLQPQIGRYLEYPFLKLNDDVYISLKFDRFSKYKDDPYAN